ncbi:hypothetical protein KC19_VG082100 [Ceratodon purpureus]|uniref:Uncharacterized protein n=1 Tax=Ceratodon purpureus TaxID=3225 RepID=A0A8T0HN76_CERPU|nr:hypothetical protein KC19_VG082100 [Ceratodon purpureus]
MNHFRTICSLTPGPSVLLVLLAMLNLSRSPTHLNCDLNSFIAKIEIQVLDA